MDKKDLRIVYFGTPEFAVGPLHSILENGFNVVGVVTAPDKPAGRGRKIQYSDVKKYAIEKGLNILQPTNLKSDEFAEELKSLSPTLNIIVAFRMLPEKVWAMPEIGSFNLHASLLPQYRGAAPINWAIINGEKESGVTTFFLKHEIDTGNVILQRKVEILDDENVGSLYTKLMEVGSELVVETSELILSGKIETKPQNVLAEGIELKSAPKIFKNDCKINWEKPINETYNLIRGLSPYPAAWTELKHKDTGKTIITKIYGAKPISTAQIGEIGSIDSDNKTHINIIVNDGAIAINELQLAGKKRMPTSELLKGFDISAYEINK